jgi:hypothetical protein
VRPLAVVLLLIAGAACATRQAGTTPNAGPWRRVFHVDSHVLAEILDAVLPPCCSLVRKGADKQPRPDFVPEHAEVDAARNAVRWWGSPVSIAEADALIDRLDVPWAANLR